MSYFFRFKQKFSAAPQLAEIITPEPLIVWGCIYTFWKGLKNYYHFYIGYFSWFCTILRQQSFARLSSVQIRICIQYSTTCALCSNDHNFFSIYQIWAYESWMESLESKLQVWYWQFSEIALGLDSKVYNSQITQICSEQNFSNPTDSKLHNS
jgi:hypothetical protein